MLKPRLADLALAAKENPHAPCYSWAEAWDEIVMQGGLASRGMPQFDSILEVDDGEALRAYVIQQAWRAKDLQDAR